MKLNGQWSIVSRRSPVVLSPCQKTTEHEARTTAHAAFTLIELMVVVGIMALIMAIGIPFMANVVNGGKGISRAVRDVQQVCSDARALAILQQRPVELRIHPHDGTFDFGTASAGTAVSAGEDYQPASGSGGSGSNSAELPEGVVIEGLGVNGFDWTDDETAYIVFRPNGTSDEMRMILYRPSSSERRYMHLEVVTGLAVLEETDVKDFMKVR